MATEKRKAEETVCIDLLVTLLSLKGAKHLQGIIEDGSAACLGEKCQMYATHFRGCGKRLK